MVINRHNIPVPAVSLCYYVVLSWRKGTDAGTAMLLTCQCCTALGRGASLPRLQSAGPAQFLWRRLRLCTDRPAKPVMLTSTIMMFLQGGGGGGQMGLWLPGCFED